MILSAKKKGKLGSITDCGKCTYKDKCSNPKEKQQHLDRQCRKRNRHTHTAGVTKKAVWEG
jgi:hypothetical protein